MDPRIEDFVEEDKEFLAKLWQKNQNILGHSKNLRDSIKSHILVLTHPLGEQMLKTMNTLVKEQESKIEIIEERMDEYEEMLDG